MEFSVGKRVPVRIRGHIRASPDQWLLNWSGDFFLRFSPDILFLQEDEEHNEKIVLFCTALQ